MKKHVRKIRAASKQSKLIGLAVFIFAFAGIGGLVVLRSRAAAGLCSTANVVGTGTYNVSAPETATYRLWVRMQVPDTTNTNNLNGVRVEVAGSSNQCFTVTTTASNAVNQWQWVNSDALAASTPHITTSIASGNYTAKILGLRAGVKVDKVLLLKSDNTCTPSNVISGSAQPGDNCTTPVPSVTLTANPTSVTSGSSSTLTWSSTNATGCTSSGSWTGSRATSGTFNTGALTANQSYSLVCTGVGGTSTTATATVTVTAPAAPTVTLTANPTTIVSGNASTLTWSSTNATACTAGNGWTGSKTTSGSQSTGALTANRTYTLVCTGPGGTSNTASATVTVTATPPPTDTTPPTVTMTLPGITLSSGQTTVIVKTMKSVTWTPIVTDNATLGTVTYTVNDQPITLTNGSYIFGNGTTSTTRNGDYTLRVVATDSAGNTTTATLTVRLRHADFNRSGRIDVSDLGALTQNWGTQSTNYDIAGTLNGTVDVSDLGTLLQRWNATD